MDRPTRSFLSDVGHKPGTPEPDGGSGSGATPQPYREPARGFEQAVLEGELNSVRRATEGSRNATLNQAAFNLAQVMPVDTWHSELMSAAVQSGLGRTEAANTIKSAMAGAARNPRSAHRMPGNGPVRPVETLPGVDGYRETPDASQAARTAFFDWSRVGEPRAGMEWLVEPILPAGGRLVSIYSPPGVGKSLLALDMAIAVARGGQVLGVQATRASVLYLDYENTAEDLLDRVEDMDVSGADLTDLHYVLFPELAMLDTAQGGAELVALAASVQARLVVIDTLSRCVQGEENDAATMLAMYRHALMPLKAAGVTVLRLDHTGKDLTRGQVGTSAKSRDVDLIWRYSEIVPRVSFVLECEKQRIRITEDKLNVRRTDGPTAHQVDTRTIGQAKEQAILDALDEAGLPKSAGRDRVRQVLQGVGIKVRDTTLAEIIKRRQGVGLHLVEDD